MTESMGTFCPMKQDIPDVPKHSVGLPGPSTKLKVTSTSQGESFVSQSWVLIDLKFVSFRCNLIEKFVLY